MPAAPLAMSARYLLCSSSRLPVHAFATAGPFHFAKMTMKCYRPGGKTSPEFLHPGQPIEIILLLFPQKWASARSHRNERLILRHAETSGTLNQVRVGQALCSLLEPIRRRVRSSATMEPNREGRAARNLAVEPRTPLFRAEAAPIFTGDGLPTGVRRPRL
jgi:hypothetical protein